MTIQTTLDSHLVILGCRNQP